MEHYVNFLPIMMSYKLRNVIRDPSKIYCFSDNNNEGPIEIKDN